MSTPEYIVGVDLGRQNDYTAVSILERFERPTGETKTITRTEPNGLTVEQEQPIMEVAYHVRHLERRPLGEPYPQQVAVIADIVTRTKTLRRSTRLVVDATGVGVAVVDLLRQAGLQALHAVTITGGDRAARDGLDHRTPKRDLVAVVQVLLQAGRLGIASELPLSETLATELAAFKVTFSPAGHDSYGNAVREAAHDDLVLSVALAAWLGETVQPVQRPRNMSASYQTVS